MGRLIYDDKKEKCDTSKSWGTVHLSAGLHCKQCVIKSWKPSDQSSGSSNGMGYPSEAEINMAWTINEIKGIK